MKKVSKITGLALLYIVGIFLLVLNMEVLDRVEWNWSTDIIIVSIQYTLYGTWWALSLLLFFIVVFWPSVFLTTKNKMK